MPIKQVTRCVSIWNAFALSDVNISEMQFARGSKNTVSFLFFMKDGLQASSFFIFIKPKSIDYEKRNISK